MNWYVVAFGVVFAGLGLLLLWGLWREFALLARMRREGIETTGIVVRHVVHDRDIDRPVIQFVDRRGQQVEFSPDPVRLDKFVEKGTRFAVSYLADRPHDARLVGTETRRRGFLASVGVGVLFSGLGLAMLSGAVPKGGYQVQIEPGSALEWVFAGGMILTAALPVLLFAGGLRKMLALRRAGVRTRGTVLRAYKGDKGTRLAVVEFFDLGGRRIQFVCRGGERSVGEAVPVVYPRDTPEDAERDSLTPIVVPLVALSTFALVVLAGMVHVMFFK